MYLTEDEIYSLPVPEGIEEVVLVIQSHPTDFEVTDELLDFYPYDEVPVYYWVDRGISKTDRSYVSKEEIRENEDERVYYIAWELFYEQMWKD